MDLCWPTVSQRCVEPLVVIKPTVVPYVTLQGEDRLIVLEVNILIFHRLPQSLDKDFVKHPPRLSMLMATWRSLSAWQRPARRIRALVSVEAFGSPVCQRLCERGHTQGDIQGIREALAQAQTGQRSAWPCVWHTLHSRFRMRRSISAHRVVKRSWPAPLWLQ